MRDSWTDERLDRFAHRTDERFDGVEKRMDRLERRMDGGFGRIDARIDALTQAMSRLGAGLIVTLVIGFLSVLKM